MAMKKMSLEKKHNLTGWLFLLPASLLIFVFCFYPMVQALILSFKSGMGNTEHWVAIANYTRILKDKTFQQCLFNTIFYFVIQVPIMLLLSLILAQLLNSPAIKGNLTAGGPGKATMTLTHYIYNISFVETPKFNYAAALSVFILVVVAVLSAIQMKVGDKRE